MSEHLGTLMAVNGNLIRVAFTRPVRQNEIGYAMAGDIRCKAEVVRIRDGEAELQVFEDTRGLRVGGEVRFTGRLLEAELGPGLLGRVFDGLQNPLHEIARTEGFFLPRGVYPSALDRDRSWAFTAQAAPGDRVRAGDVLGYTPEGVISHHIMVPFDEVGVWEVLGVFPGKHRITDTIARLRNEQGEVKEISMLQRWPVKLPVTCYAERLRPVDPLVTKVRIVDTLCPVARGGTFCVPGPFGAGKTVLQQLISRHAEVDVVIIAACGERAGEVVETVREFPELMDPRTGRSLMERTIIICNTSSMPVAAREASVYTAITLAEYYRQMGLHVLLLADSTSRWAQALRELSGRLEEIPGEEAFPAYLESVIASFYERGGRVLLNDGREGSVTIGGTVSPAGGNFEEPVTQATLKVVGAFHGLSRQRSDARRFPAIDPLESWSKYPGVVEAHELKEVRSLLRRGNEVAQMMKVIGEEGTSLDDFVGHLKAEFLDSVYLQQDAFHPVDGATGKERQCAVFGRLMALLRTSYHFQDKSDARTFFQQLAQAFRDWNLEPMECEAYRAAEERLREMSTQRETKAHV